MVLKLSNKLDVLNTLWHTYKISIIYFLNINIKVLCIKMEFIKDTELARMQNLLILVMKWSSI